MGFDPVSFAIYALITIGTTAIQRQQQRRAQRRARRAFEEGAGVDLRFTPSAQPVPVCYGATAAHGIQVYAQTARSLPQVPATPNDGPAFGELEAHEGERKNHAYLLTQNVVSVAGNQAVHDIHVDAKPWSSDGIREIVAHGYREDGVAMAAASAFKPEERSATDYFTGLLEVTGAYFYDIDKPVFGAPPALTVFLSGRLTHSVLPNGTLSATKTYSSNAVRVLLDYLTQSEFGPMMSLDDIDLPSFYVAQEQADEIVQGPGSVLWGVPYPDDLNDLFGTSYATWGAYFTALGYTDRNDSGVGDFHGAGAPILRRYECNGNIPTTRDYPDVIDQILECMPGVQFFYSLEGRWKIKLPRVDVPAAQQAVNRPIVAEDLDEPIAVVHPDSSEKLNRLTGRFANILLDLANDSLTWPPETSQVHRDMRARDGDVALSASTTLELTNNPYHAASILANEVLASRRPLFRIIMRPRGYLYEAGDVVPVQDEEAGINSFVLIEKVNIQESLSTVILGREFHPCDYRWYTEAKLAFAERPQPATQTPTISVLTARLGTVAGVRSVNLAWVLQPYNGPPVTSIEIQQRIRDGATAAPAADDTEGWVPLAIVDGDADAYLTQLSLSAQTAEYRARPITAVRFKGDWTQSNALVLQAPSQEDVIGDALEPPTLDTPPLPEGLEVVCGFEFCSVQFNNPYRQYANHKNATIYRGTSSDFRLAQRVGTVRYLNFFDENLSRDTTYYYWVGFVSTTNVTGPIAGPVEGRTGIDVKAAFRRIREQVLNDPLTKALTAPFTNPDFLPTEVRRIAELALLEPLDLSDRITEEMNRIGRETVRNGDEILALEEDVRSVRADVDGKATSAAVDTLRTQVTANQGNIRTLSQRQLELFSDLDDKADASALQTLRTEVEENEKGIKSLSTEQTSLRSQIAGKANASALRTLQTEVTEVDRKADGNATRIRSLSTEQTSLRSQIAGKADASALRTLQTEVDQNEGRIRSLSTEQTTLRSQLAGKANASALRTLQTEVDQNEGRIRSLSTEQTTLRSQIAGKADASALRTLQTEVDQNEGRIRSLSTEQTTLRSQIAGKADASAVRTLKTEVDDLEDDVAGNAGNIRSLSTEQTTLRNQIAGKASSSAVRTLESKVTREVQRLDGKANTNAARISSVSTEQTRLRSQIAGKADASALRTLQTEVSGLEDDVEGHTRDIRSLSTEQTKLENEIDGKASSSALRELQSDVRENAGDISSASRSLTRLESKVNGLPSASALQLLETRVGNVEDLDGNTDVAALARWLVKTRVRDLEGSVGLYNDGRAVRFSVLADRFQILSRTTSSFGSVIPFYVEGGKVYINVAVIEDASIEGAKIKLATIDDAHIKALRASKISGLQAEFEKLDVDLANVKGTLTADHVDADVANIRFLASRRFSAISTASWASFRMAHDIDEFDFVMIFVRPRSSGQGGTNSNMPVSIKRSRISTSPPSRTFANLHIAYQVGAADGQGCQGFVYRSSSGRTIYVRAFSNEPFYVDGIYGVKF